jgi:hypothetical protein
MVSPAATVDPWLRPFRSTKSVRSPCTRAGLSQVSPASCGWRAPTVPCAWRPRRLARCSCPQAQPSRHRPQLGAHHGEAERHERPLIERRQRLQCANRGPAARRQPCRRRILPHAPALAHRVAGAVTAADAETGACCSLALRPAPRASLAARKPTRMPSRRRKQLGQVHGLRRGPPRLWGSSSPQGQLVLRCNAEGQPMVSSFDGRGSRSSSICSHLGDDAARGRGFRTRCPRDGEEPGALPSPLRVQSPARPRASRFAAVGSSPQRRAALPAPQSARCGFVSQRATGATSERGERGERFSTRLTP